MIRTDEDALICDFAETYHVFDYRALPLRMAALLACGLRETSRIRRRMAGVADFDEMLLQAAILDRLSILQWFQSEDGQAGKNRPASIYDQLTGRDQPDEDTVEGFGNSYEFVLAWKKITKGGS